MPFYNSRNGCACLAVMLLLLAVVVSAIDENTTFTVIYSGDTTIKDTLATKSTDIERASYLSGLVGEKLKPIKFPYFIPDDKIADKTVIAINGYRCTPYYCGYWISATRAKKLIQTNPPVWIYPPPYQIIETEVEDVATNSVTYTVAENPQAAMEEILRRYVRAQP